VWLHALLAIIAAYFGWAPAHQVGGPVPATTTTTGRRILVAAAAPPLVDRPLPLASRCSRREFSSILLNPISRCARMRAIPFLASDTFALITAAT
jgi:hypothetical protein